MWYIYLNTQFGQRTWTHLCQSFSPRHHTYFFAIISYIIVEICFEPANFFTMLELCTFCRKDQHQFAKRHSHTTVKAIKCWGTNKDQVCLKASTTLAPTTISLKDAQTTAESIKHHRAYKHSISSKSAHNVSRWSPNMRQKLWPIEAPTTTH